VDTDPPGFRAFVDDRGPALLRAAWLLTDDWQHAEDLVQTALAKTLPRWSKIARQDGRDAYVRRTMIRTFLSWRTRRWTGEIPFDRLPEPDGDGDLDATDVRLVLLDAVRDLPRRQRAVVVLRYFEDLTEASTAAALGCSVGTVKSYSARALDQLRKHSGLSALFDEEMSDAKP
jgi:RNA polymerase sigma-70 factor (sigma-E family)